MPSAVHYPIAAAARLTGLSIDTIRAWERRYGAVAPERGARGRIFTEAQVERLRRLSALVRQGHAISDVAGLSDSKLGELLGRTAAPLSGPGGTGATHDASSPVARIVAAIERFDQLAADREVARLAALHPSRSLVHEVALPLMRDAGDRWHRGAWSVAQEHMLSAILRTVVGGIARLEPTPEDAPRVVFATPEGEQHEFGILAAAMLAAASRLGVVYLGASLPAAEIAAVAEEVGAVVVVIGVTSGSAVAVDQVADIRRFVRTQTEVWAGGPRGLRSRVKGGRRKAVLVLESFDEFERQLTRLGSRRDGGRR